MRRFKRFLPLVIIAAMATAVLVPVAVSGWGGRRFLPQVQNIIQNAAFTATADVTQTVMGNREPANIFGVPHLRNTGQVFLGKVTETNWGTVRNADITINHNSAITINSEFDQNGTATLTGFAWGEFELDRDWARAEEQEEGFGGKYVVGIEGTITLDPSCPVDPALGAMIGRDSGAWVEVIDKGTWDLMASEGSIFEGIGAIGNVTVRASGCLDRETATISISGVRHEPQSSERLEAD